MTKILLFLTVIIGLTIPKSIFGQDVDPNLIEKIGKNIYVNEIRGEGLQTDSILVVRDDQMQSNNTLSPEIEKSYFVQDYIVYELKITDSVNIDQPFNSSINLEITALDSLGNLTNYNVELTVGYDTTDNEIENKAIYKCENGHILQVQIIDKEVSDPNAEQALVLRNEIHTSRNSDFDCNQQTVFTTITPDPDHQELIVNWDPINGATHYDLEWTFLEENSLEYLNYPTLTTTKDLFNNNATRITTSEKSYSIKLGYPAGKIVYRVRPVQYSDPFIIINGPWSDDINNNYDFDGLENEKNWQFTANFIEDGKRKTTSAYYDGLNRNKQINTINESDKAALVSNSYYNKEGLLVAQSLPAPYKEYNTNGTIKQNAYYLNYQNNFNKDQNGQKFNADDLASDICNTTTGQMGNSSGAGRYYSTNSEFLDDFHKMVPDAEGYPYTEKIYSNDNTGRVIEQSGPGLAHHLGQGHETKFFYAKPSIEELYRLFGLEVGEEQYYNKEAVQDPNGQFSITYKDGKDRIIATALSGSSPSNMIAVDGNTTQNPITVSLVRNQVIDIDKISLDYFFIVSSPGQYSFHYNINEAPNANFNDCDGNHICYDCKYDVNIKLNSICLTKKEENENNYVLGQWDTVCTQLYNGIDINFIYNFAEAGTYSISKVISINKEMKEQYLNDFLSKSSCKTFNDFYTEAIAQIDFSGCNITCDQCLTKLGTLSTFLSNAQNNITSTGGAWNNDIETNYRNIYNQLYENCNKLCNPNNINSCEIFNTAMLLDVSPGGQFFQYEIDPTSNIFSCNDPTSMLYEGTGFTARYKDPSLVYLDENNNPIQVDILGTLYTPNLLTPEQFARFFQPVWANTLVQQHPEYCFLSLCNEITPSKAFDQHLLDIKSFDEAVTEGIIDGNGSFIGINIGSVTAPDPIYLLNNPLSANFLNDMRSFLDSYSTYAQPANCTGPPPLSGSVTVVQAALITLQNISQNGCPQTLDAINSLCDGDKNFVWNMIRTLYLQKKQEFYIALRNNSPCASIANHIGSSKPEFEKLGYTPGLISSYDLKEPRFLMIPPPPPPTPQVGDVVQEAADEAVATCESYIQYWEEKLTACGVTNTTILNNITNYFVQLCTAGVDQLHPYGSSSIPTSTPNWPYSFYSFQEILDYYSIPCNAISISMPPAYNQAPAINPNIYDEVPECTCTQLAQYQSEFEIIHGIYTSQDQDLFAEYLYKKYNSNLSGSQIQELLDMCNQTGCRYLSEIIVLPDALSCQVCKSCSEVETAIGYFNSAPEFSAYIGTEKYPDLISNYLNQQFGFNYTWSEYTDFRNNCIGETTTPPPHCQELSNAVNLWNTTPSLNTTVPACLYLNMQFNVNWTLLLWNNYINEECPNTGTINFMTTVPTCEALAAAIHQYWSSDGVNTGSGWQNSLFNFMLNNYWNSSSNISSKLSNCNLMDAFNLVSISTCNVFSNYKSILSHATPAIIYLSDSLVSLLREKYYSEETDAYVRNMLKICGSYQTDPSCSSLNQLFNSWQNNLTIQTSFADYVNTQNNWNYSQASYEAWKNHCGLNFSGYLCYKELMPPSEPNPDDCYQSLLAIAEANAYNAYETYLQGLELQFNNTYLSSCINGLNGIEAFSMTYAPTEYHYTLYYYDRAGNLMKTVPPEGVVLLTSTEVQNLISNPTNALPKYPNHSFVTWYQYNSYNKIIEQHTPDAGNTKFWYDILSRPVLSQNAEQGYLSHNSYSYSLYDDLSRIKEVGKIVNANSIGCGSYPCTYSILSIFVQNSSSRKEVIKTYYDEVAVSGLQQDNLLMRVASSTYSDDYSAISSSYQTATHYSYDISGNVKTVYQENKSLNTAHYDQSIKKIDYLYDLASGKVNKVIYQGDKAEQFIHKYEYDADNKLKIVSTGVNGQQFDIDANYTYYLHGPLARTVIGNERVQGLDYSYTIQGWLKSVNSALRDPWKDAGKDGWIPTSSNSATSPNSNVARDALAFTLSYFENDYKPVGGNSLNPELNDVVNWISPFAGNLYNGNIRSMTVDIQGLAPMGTAYKYDQLNRLKATQTRFQPNSTLWKWDNSSVQNSAFQENNIQYDKNGNLKVYVRLDENGSRMDDLTYSYINGTNKLDHVNDAATTSYTQDIESQNVANYDYDQNGNLVHDNIENLTIFWNNFGKIDSIRDNKESIALKFVYDPSGNRVEKRYYPYILQNKIRTITYYVRDAQGTIMATYKRDQDYATNTVNPTDNYSFNDWMIYGSSRLGSQSYSNILGSFTQTVDWVDPLVSLRAGRRTYELTNHLGNVLATISDLPHYIDYNNDGNLDYNIAYVQTAQDYYPFGMLMPTRNINSSGYRFSFNGMENDNEIKGTGNSLDFGSRIYDPRLGRWLSIDPKFYKYAGLSGYSAFNNSPEIIIDPGGETLRVAGGAQANADIYSLVAPVYASRIQISNSGEVILNLATDDPTLAPLPPLDPLTGQYCDAGFQLLINLTAAREKYTYSVETTYSVIVRTPNSDDKVRTLNIDVDPNHVDNISTTRYYPSSRNEESNIKNKSAVVPADGSDGYVVVDPNHTFTQGGAPWERSSVVFHELSENYYRTTMGLPYEYPKYNKLGLPKPGSSFNNNEKDPTRLGAHDRANKDEKDFHKQSLTPGTGDY